MKTPLHLGYSGYYTGRVPWSKQRRWGNLEFGSSCSSLTAGAEGEAFRQNHKLYVTVGALREWFSEQEWQPGTHNRY